MLSVCEWICPRWIHTDILTLMRGCPRVKQPKRMNREPPDVGLDPSDVGTAQRVLKNALHNREKLGVIIWPLPRNRPTQRIPFSRKWHARLGQCFHLPHSTATEVARIGRKKVDEKMDRDWGNARKGCMEGEEGGEREGDREREREREQKKENERDRDR